MKKLLRFLTLFSFTTGVAAGLLHAQDFEGTITWTLHAEITDPAMKAQIDSARAQTASPEMQAKMAQAQAAMQTPQMQEMMKQNPQLRAMMEKQMATLSGGGAAGGGNPMEKMIPKGFTLKAKGTRSLAITEGGIAPSEILTLGDQKVSYSINRDQKTYRTLPTAAGSAASGDSAFKITRTSETAQILDYTCTRVLVEPTSEAQKTTFVVWVTKDIKGFDAKQLAALRVGRDRGPNFLSQLDGVPLKVEITAAQMNLTMQVTAIKAESLPDSLFALPAGFTETKN
jgi:uncharacterized protein DUF4412